MFDLPSGSSRAQTRTPPKRFAFCFTSNEVDRQAMIVNDPFRPCLDRHGQTRAPDNQRMWADLQAALFAAL
jgi:hypothetical protein